VRSFGRYLSGGKRVNLRAVLILAGCLVGLAVSTHLLHGWQVHRNAGGLLEHADKLERQGRLAEAADQLEQYLGLRPFDTDALARQGLLLSRLARTDGDRLRPLRILQQVLHRDGRRQDVRREAVGLALRLGLFGEARVELEILLKDGPEDAELLHLRGRCEAGLRRYDRAVGWYKKAVRKDPRRHAAFLEYAALLRGPLGSPGEADAVVDALVAGDPRSPQARLLAARYFQRCGLPGRAEPHLGFALGELGCRSGEALLLAAEVALALGKAEEARGRLEEGSKLDPKNPCFRWELARLELRQGQRQKALAQLEPLLQALPEQPQELWELGNLLIEAGAAERAGAVAERLQKQGPAAQAACLRARLLMHRGAWGEARAVLDKVRAEVPGNSPLAGRLNLLLADCHEHLDNPDQRLDACRRALTASPDSLPARRVLAAALAALGKLDAAAQEYRGLIGRAPEVRVELARLLVRRNLRLPKAARGWGEVERLLGVMPAAERDSVAGKLLRAEVLVAQGKVEQARKLIEAERDRDPGRLAPWLFLARLAGAPGKSEAVFGLLEQAEQAVGKRVEWQLLRAHCWATGGGPQAAERVRGLEASARDFADADRDRLWAGLAEAFVALGQGGDAERLWGQLAQRRPGDLTVRFLLLEKAYEAGREAELRRWLEDIRRLEGGGALTAYGEGARLLLLVRSGKKERLAEARAKLAAAGSLRPSWARVPLREAEAFELEGRKDKALEKYREALGGGEKSLGVVRRALQLMYEQRLYGEAQALLRELPEGALSAGGLEKMAAQLALLTPGEEYPGGARRRALELARKAVADSGDYREHLWLGQVASLASEAGQAEKAFRRALALKGEAPDAWAALILFLAPRDPKRAEAEIAKARQRLSAAEAPLALAPCYEALGLPERAEEEYLRQLKLRPQDPLALRGAAGFFLRAAQPARAEPHLRALLAAGAPEATAAWARRALAIALAIQGGYPRFKQAQAVLDASATRDSVADRQARALVLATQPARRRQAIALFEGLVPRGGPLPPHARFLLAQLYEADGHWAKAEIELLGLLATHANNPAYLARYINGLLREGRAAEAHAWVEKLAAAAPKAPETLQCRVLVLKARGEPEQAAALVRAYARGKDARLDVAAGWLEQLGRPAEAERLYREHAASAKQPEAVLLVALHLGRQKKVAEALEVCAKAWASCRPEEVAGVSVAVVRSPAATSAQRRGVEGRLKAALGDRPQAHALAVLLADLYDQQGRQDEAVRLYRKILGQDGRNVVALNNLSYLLAFGLGDVAEALDLINRAIDLAGPVDELLDTRAVIFLKKGQADQAVTDLQQALAQASSPTRHFHLAWAQHLAGNRAAAVDAWGKAARAGLREGGVHPLERPAFRRLLGELK
jgi:tetratricopeptide (TPR) repeat protein